MQTCQPLVPASTNTLPWSLSLELWLMHQMDLCAVSLERAAVPVVVSLPLPCSEIRTPCVSSLPCKEVYNATTY